MKAAPEGCAHAYRVQFAAASSIVVWCKSHDGQKTVDGYSTTSTYRPSTFRGHGSSTRRRRSRCTSN